MSCPRVGPCNSFISCADLCCIENINPADPCSARFPDPCIVNGKALPRTLIDNSILAASEIIWAATGRQFGTCTTKIRPCRAKCGPCGESNDWFDVRDFASGFAAYPWFPALGADGLWTNISTLCGCQDRCCHVCEIELPGPVCCIDEVKVDGLVVGPSMYRVDNFNTLVRLPGAAIRTPITSLNTIATKDSKALGIHITGAGSVYPNPTLIGAPAATNDNPAPTGCGALLATDGVTYQVKIDDLRKDIFLEICGPIGVDPWTFRIGGTANGKVEIDNISGSDATVHYLGTVSDVTVIPDFVTDNVPMCVRVRIVSPSNIQTVTITPQNTGGQGLALCAIQWTDPTPVLPTQFPEALDGSPDNKFCWPDCQNLSLPDTETNTFSVTVTYGREPPQMVKFATAEFACQLIKSCAGGPCQLPQRIQNISRQGITIGMLDPMVFLEKGHTGIYLVDMVINQYNPARLPRRAGVSSIDFQPRWRVAGTDKGGCK